MLKIEHEAKPSALFLAPRPEASAYKCMLHSDPCFNCLVMNQDKENQPFKKARLSLSRKGKSKNKDASERFSFANNDEVKAAGKGVVPDNTSKNNRWAENNFVQWTKARESSDEPVPEDLLSWSDLDPTSSIYLLLCGLYRISYQPFKSSFI